MQAQPGPGTIAVPGPRLSAAWLSPPAVLAAAAVVMAGAAVIVNTLARTWSTDPGPQLLVDATVGIGFPVVGALILLAGRLDVGARRLAQTFLVAGLCSAAAALTTALGLRATEVTALTRLWSQLQSFLWVPGFLPLLTIVPLLYPNGLLPGRLWRTAALASLVGITCFTVGVALYDEDLAGRIELPKLATAQGPAQVLSTIGVVLLLPGAVAAFAAQAVRLRRSRGLARRQVVVLICAATLLVAVTAIQGPLPSPWDALAQAGAVALIPLAIGVAVTRHRLYDLDLAVCRALVIGSLTLCLIGAYLSVFALLQVVGDGRATVSAAVAAGITGAVLQPLGRRLATGVDRLYFGDRADPFAMTSRLAARLTTSGTDVEDVPAIVCHHIVTDLRLRGARVTIGAGEELTVAAQEGSVDIPGASRFELRHRGATVGVLEVSPRLGEQRVHERDLAVLTGVADQAAPAVAAVQLHHALQRSREALVAAREAERRGLRHDLHDGLGATLAGLRLQLETARDLSQHEAVVSLLTAATGGIAQAVAEVRTLCEGLRPPGIDDLGLSRALIALADRIQHPGLQLDVDVEPDLRLDPAIEVAVYRIAAEALANVARHSGAASAALTVHVGSHVELTVRDDGVGLAGKVPETGSGLGLPSMRQRAEEVGGRLTVGTPAGGGTEVRAVLPRTLEGAA